MRMMIRLYKTPEEVKVVRFNYESPLSPLQSSSTTMMMMMIIPRKAAKIYKAHVRGKIYGLTCCNNNNNENELEIIKKNKRR